MCVGHCLTLPSSPSHPLILSPSPSHPHPHPLPSHSTHPLTLTLSPLTQLTLSLNSPSHSTHPLLLSLNSPSLFLSFSLSLSLPLFLSLPLLGANDGDATIQWLPLLLQFLSHALLFNWRRGRKTQSLPRYLFH